MYCMIMLLVTIMPVPCLESKARRKRIPKRKMEDTPSRICRLENIFTGRVGYLGSRGYRSEHSGGLMHDLLSEKLKIYFFE